MDYLKMMDRSLRNSPDVISVGEVHANIMEKNNTESIRLIEKKEEEGE